MAVKPKERFVLLYIFGDKADTPLIIRTPPRNFKKLLVQWNKSQRRFLCGYAVPGFKTIDAWLKDRGVDVIEPHRTVSLR